MNRLRKWMRGRNGSDWLNVTLCTLALVCAVLALVLDRWILDLVGIVLLGWGAFRSFSRNLSQRQRENRWFLRLFGKVRGKHYQIKDKDHRYYKCPGCGQLLRVPRGKGKVSITCRRCQTVFQRDT